MGEHFVQPLLKAENIIKTYQTGDVEVHALKGVSFTIEDGELIVVLGPSGSGKSTMLNILGGIETATSGDIFYEGKPLDWKDRNALASYRREHIGFVFQFYNLLPGLTALENIELSAELSKDPMDAKKLLAEVGLADRADHFPSRLSGGEQQRIAIARALLNAPEVILADEPTGNLDAETADSILRLLRKLNEEGTAVVMVTHNRTIFENYPGRVFSCTDEKCEELPNPEVVDFDITI